MPSRCPAGGTGVPQLRQRSLRRNPPAQRRCVSRLRQSKNIVSSKVQGTLVETRYGPDHAASVSATQNAEPSVTPVSANAKRTAVGT